jgi:hypothetical protein
MSSGGHESTSKLGLLLIGILFIVIIVIVVSYIAHPLANPNFLNLEYFFNLILVFVRAFIAFIVGTGFGLLKTVLSILAIIFITIIIYTQILLREMSAKEHHAMEHDIVTEPTTEREKNPKWQQVLALGFSPNPSDWRFAIIEADSMLDELTHVLGYQGATLGDRLKAVDPADWRTLQLAWEAHLIRNKIAHDGTDFKLDQDEARRVLGLYEHVFKEFDYV